MQILQQLLDKAQLAYVNPVSTPLATGKTLSKHDGTSLNNPSQYRTIIGALQYCIFDLRLPSVMTLNFK